MTLLRSQTKRPIDSRDYKKPGSNERLFGRNNELNASNTKDALVQLKSLLDGIDAGHTSLADDIEDNVMTASESHQILRDEYEKADVHSPFWRKTGTMLAADVYQTSVRQGFFRNFLDRVEVADGAKPEFTIVENHMVALVATTPTQVQPQVISDDATFNPPEVEIVAHVKVFEKDMRSSSVDLLDRRYNESLEAVMVTEDRLFLQAVDEIAGTELPLLRFGNSLTPANITYMRQMMETAGITPTNVLMSSTYMSDFINNNDFQSVYDDFTKREILQTGRIFSGLYGLNWFTDANRKRPNLRVLKPGDFYMFADPSMLGAYSDRGPVQATPVDYYNMGERARGWLISETLSFALLNPSAVLKGTKG
jgi:hypothetical protein